MAKSSFSPWPFFTFEEIEAVQNVLNSNNVNYWTGGECKAFEAEFARFVGTSFAISLSNGTVALELAFNSLGLKSGDEVLVTSRTFIASVSSIVNAGLVPVFIDVDKDSQNISVNTILAALTDRTKAILCVHLAGWPCDMDPILALANEQNLFVIEDCAQAHGARYKGQSVGSLGHIGCWSFCQDKIISTGGEGGMVTTNDEALWATMWSYKDHGKNMDKIRQPADKFEFRWVHDSFGSNMRMTEMQAAIGRLQLLRLTEWNERRRTNAELIWATAESLPGIRVPSIMCSGCDRKCNSSNGCVHGAYKCYIFIEEGKQQRDRILRELDKRGIPCSSGTCPEVYLEAAFEASPYRPLKRLPVAKQLGETSLMFVCHPTLTLEEVRKICNALREVVLGLGP